MKHRRRRRSRLKSHYFGMRALLNPLGAGCAVDGTGMTAENPLAQFVNKLLRLDLSQTNRAIQENPDTVGTLAQMMADIERAGIERYTREPSEAEIKFLQDFYNKATNYVQSEKKPLGLGYFEDIYKEAQSEQWLKEFNAQIAQTTPAPAPSEWANEFTRPAHWKQWACEIQTVSKLMPSISSRAERLAEHLNPKEKSFEEMYKYYDSKRKQPKIVIKDKSELEKYITPDIKYVQLSIGSSAGTSHFSIITENVELEYEFRDANDFGDELFDEVLPNFVPELTRLVEKTTNLDLFLINFNVEDDYSGDWFVPDLKGKTFPGVKYISLQTRGDACEAKIDVLTKELISKLKLYGPESDSFFSGPEVEEYQNIRIQNILPELERYYSKEKMMEKFEELEHSGLGLRDSSEVLYRSLGLDNVSIEDLIIKSRELRMKQLWDEHMEMYKDSDYIIDVSIDYSSGSVNPGTPLRVNSLRNSFGEYFEITTNNGKSISKIKKGFFDPSDNNVTENTKVEVTAKIMTRGGYEKFVMNEISNVQWINIQNGDGNHNIQMNQMQQFIRDNDEHGEDISDIVTSTGEYYSIMLPSKNYLVVEVKPKLNQEFGHRHRHRCRSSKLKRSKRRRSKRKYRRRKSKNKIV